MRLIAINKHIVKIWLFFPLTYQPFPKSKRTSLYNLLIGIVNYETKQAEEQAL